MTGEGFMGVIWREDPHGVAVCSPCGIAVIWARDHEALIDVYDELAYRANGIEITRTPRPRFEEATTTKAVIELVDQVRAERDQVQEENKQLAAQLDAVREILDGADTAEGPLAERYAKRLTRIGKAIRRWNAPAEVEVKSSRPAWPRFEEATQ